MTIARNRTQFAILQSLFLSFVLLAGHSALWAQDDSTLSVDEPLFGGLSTPDEETSAFGRTIVLVLGGVSWREYARLGAATSTATPALRRVLDEGGLGAAWLPGTEQKQTASSVPNGVSSAMLRASAMISAGTAKPPFANLPASLSQTLGVQETLSRDAAGYESASAALAYARRLDRAPQSTNLVNLGWGQLLATVQDREWIAPQEQEATAAPLGTLGAAVRRKGGKTAAIGNGEVGIDAGRGVRLRETALIAAGVEGVVDAGEVSATLLARDDEAPFGVRANGKAMLDALDEVLADPLTALVSIEWGDTRRAARYEKFCAPDVAAAHRQRALQRTDAFVSEILSRLTQPRDRLILLVVPELDAHEPQLLPIAFWRPQRGGQGALLTSAGRNTIGLIGLENIHAKIVAQLGVERTPIQAGTALAAPIDESGVPTTSTWRIRRLLSLQSGLDWLSQARPLAHGLWCALFIATVAVSLWALYLPTARLQGAARLFWCATMILPWLLWLAGLCVETTWRFGVDDGAAWKLSVALLLVACLMWFLIGATFNWFSRTRIMSTRIALAWLLLTVLGIWIGSFAMPLNGLLHRVAQDASTPVPRVGDIWALLFVSATLLGMAGLTRLNPAARIKDAAAELAEPEANVPARRAINLRPAAIWAVAVVLILALRGWGENSLAATVAFVAVGAFCVRLWLERSSRETRLRGRRITIAVVAAVAALLLWQRGGAPLIASTLAWWWPQWQESWLQWWWSAAFAATVALVLGSMLPRPRQLLRTYLATRFSRRAMLGAAALAALAGVLLIGPAAAPLMATFTLGAVIYSVMR